MNTVIVKTNDKASTLAENIVITQDGIPTIIPVSYTHLTLPTILRV